LENNLPAKSCDGDPAPILTPAAVLPSEFEALDDGMGKRIGPLLESPPSMGDVVPVEEAPERGACGIWGR
jgi:hypothetical protein